MHAFPELSGAQGAQKVAHWRRVGILGGVGPLASALFYADLVEETPASGDDDHLPVVLWSEPNIPSRRDCILRGGPSPGPALRQVVEKLATAGAEVVAVPSSTCHAFFQDFSDVSGVRCMNLVEEVAARVVDRGWSQVMVLGTAACMRADVYGEALAPKGVLRRYPSEADQEQVDEMIEAVKRGQDLEAAAGLLDEVLERVSLGSDASILACTELSVLCRRGRWDGPFADASKVLAAATLRAARTATSGET